MHYFLIAISMLFVLTGCGGSGDGSSPAGQNAAAPTTEVDEAAQRAAEVRQSVLKLVAHNYRPMAGMARGNAPFDAAVVATNSVRIHHLSEMLADAFVTDTRGSGVETEALDIIWEDFDGFRSKADALRQAAAELVETGNAGDEAATLDAVRNLGQRCGSCHDVYRLDD